MTDPQLRLAATVVLLRDTEQGLETLLLRRNAKLAFAAGAWVFPGGAIDQPEIEAAETEMQAARVAAVREVQEECGLNVAEEELVHFSNWTTPEGENRRFATWFFVAEAQRTSADVVIDDGEIHEFQWLTPQQALDRHYAGELNMMPPTYLSMRLIAHYQTVAEACERLKTRKPYEVTPVICQSDEGILCLYPGDAGYIIIDPELPGPRHRTLFNKQGTQYIHSGADVSEPAMDLP
jgi:8-oxo-dGTP pyrophosphatase MutT (NUDIX family)